MVDLTEGLKDSIEDVSVEKSFEDREVEIGLHRNERVLGLSLHIRAADSTVFTRRLHYQKF